MKYAFHRFVTTCALCSFSKWADGMAVSALKSELLATQQRPLEVVPPRKADWSQWLPPLWSTDQLDVRVEWTTSASCDVRRERTAAAAWSTVQQANRWKQEQSRFRGMITKENDLLLQEELAHCFQIFEDYCRQYLEPAETCRARLVASRGRRSTKCPEWHTDYVPVRWIQAFAGPGCVWAEREDGAPDASARQAATGTALLLPGRYWNDACLGSSNPSDRPSVSAIRHKSPKLTLPWQGRILLTIDVNLPAPDN